MAYRTVGDVVAARVKKTREARSWTQQQLVDRLAELGHPMNRVTLAKLEKSGSTRARNVSLVDVLALAAALDVPPTLLFLPLGQDDVVAITPTIEIHPDHARQWIEGEEPLATSDRFAINPGEWRRAALPLHLFQDLHELRDKARKAKARWRWMERTGGEQVLPQRTRYAAALTSLADHVRTMQDYGLRTAGLLSDEYEDMAEFGIDIKRED